GRADGRTLGEPWTAADKGVRPVLHARAHRGSVLLSGNHGWPDRKRPEEQQGGYRVPVLLAVLHGVHLKGQPACADGSIFPPQRSIVCEWHRPKGRSAADR